MPAVRRVKELEALLNSPFQYIILLDSHIGRLRPLVDLAQAHGKNLLVHADLIEGLKNDEAGAEFLCQQIRPDGIISTKGSVIMQAKKNGMLAIQRIFLLDSSSLRKSYELLKRSAPDYIEVLPGIMPSIIAEVRQESGLPILTGGFIRSESDVEQALAAGAAAATTSRPELWKRFSAAAGPD